MAKPGPKPAHEVPEPWPLARAEEVELFGLCRGAIRRFGDRWDADDLMSLALLGAWENLCRRTWVGACSWRTAAWRGARWKVQQHLAEATQRAAGAGEPLSLESLVRACPREPARGDFAPGVIHRLEGKRLLAELKAMARGGEGEALARFLAREPVRLGALLPLVNRYRGLQGLSALTQMPPVPRLSAAERHQRHKDSCQAAYWKRKSEGKGSPP